MQTGQHMCNLNWTEIQQARKNSESIKFEAVW